MKLPALLCSDLHLTGKPDDEYRWSLFPWLRQQCAHWEVQTLAILGDLTDAKDFHNAELVNRIVNELVLTNAAVGRSMKILQGNHDYLRAGHPFFGFLSKLPNMEFVAKITDSSAEGESCLWLPHTRTPAKDWAGLDLSHYAQVFMHQTITGAKASNGQLMEGEALPDLSAAGKIWSGDIHVPQIIGPIEYVGSPYHVHFGDRFRPRCVLLLPRGRVEVLRFPCLSRITLDVESLDALKAERLRAGDQVKVRLHLKTAEAYEWQRIRRDALDWLKAREVQVYGIELIAPKHRKRVRVSDSRQAKTLDTENILFDYVQREELGPTALEVGLELMK